MAYVISDECVACGTCAGECPVEAISEGDGKYVIDADTCVECGTCAGVCPIISSLLSLLLFIIILNIIISARKKELYTKLCTAPFLCYLVTVCTLHSYIIFSFCDFPAWRRPFFWIVDVAGSLHPIFGNVLLSSPSVQYRESGVP